MFAVMLFGFFCIILTVIFWYIELKPYFQNKVYPQPNKKGVITEWAKFKCTCTNLYRLFTYGKWFWIDLLITVSMSSVMGMGEGVAGGVLGFFISDAVSVLLLVLMRKEKKERELVMVKFKQVA
jgi:CDP-diglyceride synthetase